MVGNDREWLGKVGNGWERVGMVGNGGEWVRGNGWECWELVFKILSLIVIKKLLAAVSTGN